jgi:hypothetical protein
MFRILGDPLLELFHFYWVRLGYLIEDDSLELALLCRFHFRINCIEDLFSLLGLAYDDDFLSLELIWTTLCFE